MLNLSECHIAIKVNATIAKGVFAFIDDTKITSVIQIKNIVVDTDCKITGSESRISAFAGDIGAQKLTIESL